MKSLIVYYSYYGHTAYIADKFLEALRRYGEVDSFTLEYKGAKESFIKRILYKFFPSRAKLSFVPIDLKKYDILCLGIPVWVGRPSLPIIKYLKMCKNLKGKKIICCHIYTFEISAKRCFDYIKNILEKKGNPKIIEVFVPWFNIQNRQFLDKTINESLKKIF